MDSLERGKGAGSPKWSLRSGAGTRREGKGAVFPKLSGKAIETTKAY